MVLLIELFLYNAQWLKGFSFVNHKNIFLVAQWSEKDFDYRVRQCNLHSQLRCFSIKLLYYTKGGISNFDSTNFYLASLMTSRITHEAILFWHPPNKR